MSDARFASLVKVLAVLTLWFWVCITVGGALENAEFWAEDIDSLNQNPLAYYFQQASRVIPKHSSVWKPWGLGRWRLGKGSGFSPSHTISWLLEQELWCSVPRQCPQGFPDVQCCLTHSKWLWIVILLILGPLSKGLFFISSFDVRLFAILPCCLQCDHYKSLSFFLVPLQFSAFNSLWAKRLNKWAC